MKCFELASATAYSLTALLAVQQTDRTTAADGGAFVQVGTHRMYVRCVGNAGSRPTVILESGGGGHSGDWTSVQSAVPSDIRTCAYDRAGLGRSEKGPSPRTMKQEIFELHAMLAAANIKGPYVLVGQSIGGVTVRLYAQQYREDVAGMVLVDPTHESSVLGSLRYGGMVRLREKAAGRSVPAPRLVGPSDVPEQPDVDYLAEELAELYNFRQETPRPLADKPLVVLAAGKRPPPPPGITPDVWSGLRDERDAQLRGLIDLSSNSAYVKDASSGHAMHTDNPQLIAKAIQAVVEAAMSGTHVKL
jgi:pimeloyl-ACP methyl ester carboxylesterase